MTLDIGESVNFGIMSTTAPDSQNEIVPTEDAFRDQYVPFLPKKHLVDKVEFQELPEC